MFARRHRSGLIITAQPNGSSALYKHRSELYLNPRKSFVHRRLANLLIPHSLHLYDTLSRSSSFSSFKFYTNTQSTPVYQHEQHVNFEYLRQRRYLRRESRHLPACFLHSSNSWIPKSSCAHLDHRVLEDQEAHCLPQLPLSMVPLRLGQNLPVSQNLLSDSFLCANTASGRRFTSDVVKILTMLFTYL